MIDLSIEGRRCSGGETKGKGNAVRSGGTAKGSYATRKVKQARSNAAGKHAEPKTKGKPGKKSAKKPKP